MILFLLIPWGFSSAIEGEYDCGMSGILKFKPNGRMTQTAQFIGLRTTIRSNWYDYGDEAIFYQETKNSIQECTMYKEGDNYFLSCNDVYGSAGIFKMKCIKKGQNSPSTKPSLEMNFEAVSSSSDESQKIESSQSISSSNYIVASRELNIRDKPEKLSKIVGKLKKGSKVQVYSFSGKWAKTDYGWMSGKYLRLENKRDIEVVGENHNFMKGFNVTLKLNGAGESCKIKVGAMGDVVMETSCLSSVNSRRKRIFCTQDKTICKTYQEIKELLYSDETYRNIKRFLRE